MREFVQKSNAFVDRLVFLTNIDAIVIDYFVPLLAASSFVVIQLRNVREGAPVTFEKPFACAFHPHHSRPQIQERHSTQRQQRAMQ